MLSLSLIIFILSSAIANSTIEDEYNGYRLPKTQLPSKYEIDLKLNDTIFNGNETSFNGTVRITFRVTEDTNNIQMHAPLEVFSIKVQQSKSPEKEINVLENNLDSTTLIMTLRLNETLKIDVEYHLTMSYRGRLDVRTMRGFYRSQYVNREGLTEYLVTTQFQPTYARYAFPCFDEPGFKAIFAVNITYPKGYNALSNTPLVGSPESVDDKYEKATFKETPVMSTYLLAFIVSRFTCTSSNKTDTDVAYQVCSRAGSEEDRELALNYSSVLMKQFEDITNIKYSEMGIEKMDQAAIPDFDAGAMENWGLVTYRERALLWNKIESSDTYKQNILETIAHEFAHMWFGNLVTCDWWDNTFLNEGFARFFQYFILAKVPELSTFEMDKQFIVKNQQSAFLVDSSIDSAALTARVASPSDISGKFSLISYNKGASIFRMVQNFMGEEHFFEGVRNYLKTKANSSSAPADLWNALQTSAQMRLPKGLNLTQAMDNWINKPGYPLVTVTSNGSDIILSQKRFLYSGAEDTEWYIPISYTLSSDVENFTTIWLNPGTQTLDNILQGNDWIILNANQNAYFRVNYDTHLWSRIEQALTKNHTDISVMNRAQLVDDSLNLARAGHLNYSVAFRILSYLKNEIDYYPWYSAIKGFSFLTQRLGDNSPLGAKVGSLILQLLTNVANSVSFTKLNENDQIHTMKLALILSETCRLGEENCIASAKDLFRDLRNSRSVDRNLRNIVYCNGLRYSDNIESDWEFLWNKFKTTSLSTERVTILSSLGCTKNETLLEKYLNYSVDATSGIRVQDLTTVWSSVYTSNPEGVDAALNYLIVNHAKVQNHFSGAASLLSSIADRFINEEQVKKLEDFVAQEAVHESLKSAGSAAVTAARANMQWTSTIKSDLEEYFVNTDNTSTTPTSPTSTSSIPTTTSKDAAIPTSTTSLLAILSFVIISFFLR